MISEFYSLLPAPLLKTSWSSPRVALSPSLARSASALRDSHSLFYMEASASRRTWSCYRVIIWSLAAIS